MQAVEPVAAERAIERGTRATTIGAASRPTLLDTIGGHDNNYTLIRLVLASSVIYYHAFGLTFDQGHADHLTNVLYPITTVGGLAVQCFFFLSGLFVALSYHRDRSTVGFVIKRSLRIWPGLFVCIALTATVAAIASRGSEAWRVFVLPEFHEYIRNNAVLHLTWNIPGVFDALRSQTLNGPIHTLPLEVKMYAVLAVLGAIGLIRSRVLLGIASALLMIVVMKWPTLFTEPFDVVGYGQAPIAMFFAGVVAFCVARHLRIAAWQGLPLVLLFAMTDGSPHTITFYLLVGWLMLWIGQWRWLARGFRPKQDPSYGIYIYGWPCQQLVLMAQPDMNPYLMMTLALALAWCCAMLSWRFIEQPAIDLGRSLGRRWQRRREASVSAWPWPDGWCLLAFLMALALVFAMAPKLVRSIDLLPVVPMATRIVAFGPQETIAGASINPLPDGRSAIWMTLDGTPPPSTRVVFDGTALESTVGDRLITAIVPARLLRSPGDKPVFIELRLPDRIERSDAVALVVKP